MTDTSPTTPRAGAPPPSGLSAAANWLRQLFWRFPIVALLIVLIGSAAIVTPAILSVGNILLMLRQYSALGIISIGVTFVVLCGRLDVSVGSLASLMVVVTITLHDLIGPNAAVLAALATAVLVGCINGFLVAYLRLSSLVTTLGMFAALQGVANVIGVISGRQVVEQPELSWLSFVARGFVLGIPMPVWIFATVALCAAWVMANTNFGRAVRAVGGNEKASTYSSIDAKAIIFWCFMISALSTWLAGLIMASRTMQAQADSGGGLEILALSAIFLGGTSLGGGVGGMGRTVIGVIVLACVSNSLILIGAPIQAQWLASGSIIILAVWLDSISRKRSLLA
jgi:ribose/xylose/arabinose/galactoside ABC-type transport system permease subunit